MDFIKKNWLPVVIVVAGAFLMFTAQGKKIVEMAKVWFK